jgi:hypothetical protein
MTTENWKTIPGFNSYEASDLGRIRSRRPQHGPTKSGERTSEWRVLSGSIGSRGYRKYLMMDDEGTKRTMNGHILVLETHIGNRPIGMVGRHLNDHKTDNRLENLEWGTHAENMSDAKRNGCNPRGESHKSATIRESMVIPIRQARADGTSLRDIAARFGQGIGAINHLLQGRTWTHI